jgi:16S rRNA (adenine1518-N6/adenine1519-N6)-dimethyltransferase
VATVLVRQVLGYPERIPRAAVLVQKEVGERLVAKPGDKPYGALSVHAASSARVRWLGRVKKGSFFPPPKVDGAFVGFELQPPPLPPEEMEEFRRTVNLAFGQRRKTLRNSLGAGWGKDVAASALARAGLDGGRRAEELGLEDFLRLTAAVREQSA